MISSISSLLLDTACREKRYLNRRREPHRFVRRLNAEAPRPQDFGTTEFLFSAKAVKPLFPIRAAQAVLGSLRRHAEAGRGSEHHIAMGSKKKEQIAGIEAQQIRWRGDGACV